MINDAKWLWFSQCFGLATRKFHLALERYQTPDRLLAMTQEEIDRDIFLSPEQKKTVAKRDLSAAEAIVSETLSRGFGIISFEDAGYPELLRNIFSPPAVLFYKGDLQLLTDHYLITLVGTRKPTRYGMDCAQKLSSEIVMAGGVVVSGLASGIDAICHQTALDHDGSTIAFLSCGIDDDYPVLNLGLRRNIEKRGLVLSEFALGTRVAPQNFSIRNRLLSGVSHATIIVQCALQSGSLLTANHAINQNRDLYAVPGDIFERQSAGTNRLLSECAEVAIDGGEILARYRSVYRYPERETTKQVHTSVQKAKVELSPEQQAVVRLLQQGEMRVDDLCVGTGLEVYELLPVLTTLELLSVIKPMAGGKYKTV